MIRFHKLICTTTKLKLFNALFCPTFNTVLRFGVFVVLVLFFDKVSSFQQLLHNSGGPTLYNRRIQNMLIAIYKCLDYMKDFLNILKTCLLCVSLCTLLGELIFYQITMPVNLLLLLMASTLFATLHLRNT